MLKVPVTIMMKDPLDIIIPTLMHNNVGRISNASFLVSVLIRYVPPQKHHPKMTTTPIIILMSIILMRILMTILRIILIMVVEELCLLLQLVSNNAT